MHPSIEKELAEKVVEEAIQNEYFIDLLVKFTMGQINSCLVEHYLATGFQSEREEFKLNAGRTDKYA